VDDAMAAVERDNPSLKGVLPKDYARPALDKQRLGQLIDLITNIHLGGSDNHARDILGRVYEYFLGQFASAEGKKGGEFYTPRCIVKLLVEMLRPYKGRVYDPCCGSSGMFVQSEALIGAHGGRIGDISICSPDKPHGTALEPLPSWPNVRRCPLPAKGLLDTPDEHPALSRSHVGDSSRDYLPDRAVGVFGQNNCRGKNQSAQRCHW
jgi:hypothetical protein